MRYVGLAISEGVCYGKIVFIHNNTEYSQIDFDSSKQMEVFLRAIELVTKQIDLDMVQAKSVSDSRIVDIFEAHKHIVNDPVVVLSTKEYINGGLSAIEAYTKSVSQILEKFKKIVDPYMLGRIVDIIDATDRVKAILLGNRNETLPIHDEPSILIIKELKPSIIFASEKSNIKGFISEKGLFNQHSSIIARTLKIPGIILNNIFDVVTENDYLLVNGNTGELLLNPDKDTITKYIERGD